MADEEKKKEEEEEIEDDLDEDDEIDTEETDGNEGIDDSDVPKDEKAVEEQQEKDIAEKETDDIYDTAKREEQLAEDEIGPGEAGFMEGYENTKVVECGACNNKFDFEKVVERVINGTNYQFCSLKCAESFEKRKAGLR